MIQPIEISKSLEYLQVQNLSDKSINSINFGEYVTPWRFEQNKKCENVNKNNAQHKRHVLGAVDSTWLINVHIKLLFVIFAKKVSYPKSMHEKIWRIS